MHTTLSRALFLVAGVSFCLAATPPQVAVWTGQYDNARTAANLSEVILTPANVNTQHFGLLFSRAVDGYIYGQPLYVPGVSIKATNYNVVYVATMNNSVYAFDADNAANSAPLWQVNLGPAFQIGQGQLYIGTQVGILSTPVIDTASSTIYVVTLTVVAGDLVYSLHALDIASGQEKFNGPVVIQGYVAGTAPDARNGMLAFFAGNLLQRPALALVGSSVYIGFGTMSDKFAYHGWLFAYNKTSLQQQAILCTTPNGTKGGIWMSGRGIASDSNGIYFMIGDGSTGQGDVSSSFVRIGSSSSDYFTPDHFSILNNNDWDLNAGGPLLLPGTKLLLGAGKTGTIYLLNRTDLGGLESGNTGAVQSWQATAGCNTSTENCDELHHYAYWSKAPGQPLLYIWPWNENLRSYAFNGSTFNTTAFAQNSALSNYPGGQLAISANGGKAGTGILWAAMSNQDSATGPAAGMLRAFDATTLAEIWNSNMNAADNAGLLAKFCLPTIVNGKVYLATFSNQLNVYGLRN
jgi:hypothetical protein